MSKIRVESSPRWVRAQKNGQTIVDSRSTSLVYGAYYVPIYYFPRGDVRQDLLEAASIEDHPKAGRTQYWDLVIDGERFERAAWSHLDPPAEAPELEGLITLDWGAVDRWFEEDDEVFIHATDPRHRVDVRDSSRHIQVFVDGVKVADSHRPRVLFETGIVPRYYLPKTDVRMDLLADSDKKTGCPYKGWANYYDVDVGTGKGRQEGLVWWYAEPKPECGKIAGLVCFYNEKVDLVIDGEKVSSP